MKPDTKRVKEMATSDFASIEIRFVIDSVHVVVEGQSKAYGTLAEFLKTNIGNLKNKANLQHYKNYLEQDAEAEEKNVWHMRNGATITFAGDRSETFTSAVQDDACEHTWHHYITDPKVFCSKCGLARK